MGREILVANLRRQAKEDEPPGFWYTKIKISNKIDCGYNYVKPDINPETSNLTWRIY